MNGRLLKYRREANGQFVLHSIGWNETDDAEVIGSSNNTTPGVNSV
jgi:hypothetical protein